MTSGSQDNMLNEENNIRNDWNQKMSKVKCD